MGRQTPRKGTVRFEGAARVGLTVGPGPGDLSNGITNAENTEKVRAMDRGVYECHVETNDLEQEMSLTIFMDRLALTSAIVARILDFMNNRNFFSGVQTTNPNPDIFSWRTIWTGLNGASTTWPVCTGGYAWAEATEGNSITITWTNNGKPVET